MSPRAPSADRPRSLAPAVAVLASAGTAGSMTQTMLIPIQGELPRLLEASRDDTAWVITATLLAGAIITPIAGRLGDLTGRRRAAALLLAVFLVGSVVSALAPDVGTMIVGRALQGSGMGVIPLGIAILRDILPPERLGTAVALVSATLGVGGAIGLPVGALVAELLDWQAIFWLSAAMSAVLLVLYLTVVPSIAPGRRGVFDLGGAVGLAIGLTGVLLALSRGNDWGWSDARTLVAFGAGTVVLAGWAVHELRHRDPLVDLRVSSRRPVLLTNLASFAMGFALAGSNVAFPQLIGGPVELGGLGQSLLATGLLMIPSGLVVLLMVPITGRFERRVGPRPLLAAGGAVLAVAYVLSLLAELDVVLVLLVNAVIGVGIGIGYAAMPTLIMRFVPASESGAANSLNTLMRALGMSAGAAVAGAVLAASASGDGHAAPTATSFDLVFVLGVAAAGACAVLAACIPRR